MPNICFPLFISATLGWHTLQSGLYSSVSKVHHLLSRRLLLLKGLIELKKNKKAIKLYFFGVRNLYTK